MIRLLQIELAKILPYKAFRTLIIIFLIGFVAMPWSFETIPIFRNLQQLFEFPAIWFFYYFGAEFLSIALAIIIITVTCNEYVNQTWRQQTIDGMSRNELVMGKVLLMFAIALSLTVIFTLNGFIAGSINSFELVRSDILSKSGFIFGFFLHIFGIMSLAFFLANLLRRTGFSLFLFLAWLFPIELIIMGLLRGVAHDGGLIGSKLPVSVIYFCNVKIDEIMDDPTAILDINRLIPSGLGWENTVMKMAYIVLFIGLSWALVKRRDL
jgi:ABC-2 type transport system permease protein